MSWRTRRWILIAAFASLTPRWRWRWVSRSTVARTWRASRSPAGRGPRACAAWGGRRTRAARTAASRQTCTWSTRKRWTVTTGGWAVVADILTTWNTEIAEQLSHSEIRKPVLIHNLETAARARWTWRDKYSYLRIRSISSWDDWVLIAKYCLSKHMCENKSSWCLKSNRTTKSWNASCWLLFYISCTHFSYSFPHNSSVKKIRWKNPSRSVASSDRLEIEGIKFVWKILWCVILATNNEAHVPVIHEDVYIFLDSLWRSHGELPYACKKSTQGLLIQPIFSSCTSEQQIAKHKPEF